MSILKLITLPNLRPTSILFSRCSDVIQALIQVLIQALIHEILGLQFPGSRHCYPLVVDICPPSSLDSLLPLFPPLPAYTARKIRIKRVIRSDTRPAQSSSGRPTGVPCVL